MYIMRSLYTSDNELGQCFVCLGSKNTSRSNVCCGDLIYHNECLKNYCDHKLDCDSDNDYYEDDNENEDENDDYTKIINRNNITCPICKKSIGNAINIKQYIPFMASRTFMKCIYMLWVSSVLYHLYEFSLLESNMYEKLIFIFVNMLNPYLYYVTACLFSCNDLNKVHSEGHFIVHNDIILHHTKNIMLVMVFTSYNISTASSSIALNCKLLTPTDVNIIFSTMVFFPLIFYALATYINTVGVLLYNYVSLIDRFHDKYDKKNMVREYTIDSKYNSKN